MDYEVIDAFSAQDLTAKVKEKLAEGWFLYGELKIAPYEVYDEQSGRNFAKVLFVQAVSLQEQRKPSTFKTT